MNKRFINIAVAVVIPVLATSTVATCIPQAFMPGEPDWELPSLYGEVIQPNEGNFISVYRHMYLDEEGNEKTAALNEEHINSTQNTMLVGFSSNTLWIRVTAEPAPGYELDYWMVRTATIEGNLEERASTPYPPHDGSSEPSFTIPAEFSERIFVKAYFKEITPLKEGGPSDWTPEDDDDSDWGRKGKGLIAALQTRVEIIEGPSGCIDSTLFVDYEAVGDYQVDFLRLKKDGEEWLTWQGTPTVIHRDNTLMEVPCSGETRLELYATDENDNNFTADATAIRPHCAAGLEWDVEPVPGEECRMTLKMDFWGQDNLGENKKLASLVLTANGDEWYNQQPGTNFHEGSVSRTVTCGQIYLINLTATDIDGNKYTWRETIEIPEPEPEDEPPPQEPPQDAPPAHETLYVAFALSGQCTSSQSECTCTVSYSVDVEDRSIGDKYPVTNVKFEVNNGSGWQVWHDSGAISTSAYHHADQETGVDCDKSFNVRVTATNSIGQTVTSTGSFTTASP